MSGGRGRRSSHVGRWRLSSRFATTREIRYEALLPIGQVEAFTFVSAPANWPLFLDGVEVVAVADDWGGVGGRAQTVVHLLGRPVRSDLEITHWDPPRAFEYTARQRGRPPVDNRRAFERTDVGTRLVGSTRVTPRGGFRGVADLVAVGALYLRYRRGMSRLPIVVGKPRKIRQAPAQHKAWMPPAGRTP